MDIRPLKPLKVVEGRRKKLAYTQRAKDFVRQNPRLIKEFLNAVRSIWDSKVGAKAKYGTTTVEKLKFSRDIKKFFLVERAGKKFFVKWVSTDFVRGVVVSSIEAMREAEGIIRKHGIQPMQYEFGFEGKNGSFLVSRFYGLKNLNEVSDNAVVREADRRMNAASRELSEKGIFDLERRNLFYDPRNKKFIAFDLGFES
ncbi:MAG: hypothetical protein J4224_04695 [Candidatus Diapherotrites archaeon]|uniref:Uncharacterized protein n=1 Tax=Candidatus Iainarchaeum sp. TaxID=3101447 RepID=A0A8T4L1G1_9ARCH|nr:MAG: hypothetical protein QT03_C0001G0274 [archaeon GW2011_AR10]MBS3059692.1 hypothetical protein [Candidatus Diapherotrites archaeon]